MTEPGWATQDGLAAVDAAIREAVQAQRERDRLLAQSRSLAQDARRLEDVLTERRHALQRETRDVERLGSLTLTSVLAGLRGSRAGELDRERAEQQAAAYGVTQIESSLAQVVGERDRVTRELDALGDADARLELALTAKETVVEAAGGPQAEVLLVLAARLGQAAADLREVTEALRAGTRALADLRAAQESLDSARSWSTYDTFLGGGLVGSAVKHHRLDEAADLIRAAEASLTGYRTELADVQLSAGDPLEISGLLRGLDIWFDNIFSDLMVREKILDAADRVDAAVLQVAATQSDLTQRQASLEAAADGLEAERRELLLPLSHRSGSA